MLPDRPWNTVPKHLWPEMAVRADSSEWVLAKCGEWIPVEDELPVTSTTLVWAYGYWEKPSIPGDREVFMATCNRASTVFRWLTKGARLTGVTHWKLITKPDPPTGGKSWTRRS